MADTVPPASDAPLGTPRGRTRSDSPRVAPVPEPQIPTESTPAPVQTPSVPAATTKEPWWDKKRWQWWRIIAGDFINSNLEPAELKKHEAGNMVCQQIICLTGLLGSIYLPLVLFDTKIAMGVVCICVGGFYLGMPFDLIRDDFKVYGIPVGKFDDTFFGVVAGLGVLLLAMALRQSPIDFTQNENIIIACAVVVVAVAGYASESLRWLFAGIWAIVAQLTFFTQIIPSPTIGLGVGLYWGGFLYNVLPLDLVPDNWNFIPFIGKIDDIFLGYLPAYFGILAVVWGLVTLGA